MLVVAALGGNALLRRGEPLTAENQRQNVQKAAPALAAILRAGHQLVITHGNGPQVGLLALQGAAYKPDEAYPLDVMGAETEGMIGYLIEQELENALDHDRPVATLLTQVVVDAGDPAFGKPTKFVASPVPQEIPDTRVIKLLLEAGVVVICAGGGGIPVIRREDGGLIGVEAVVDKDASSALLALSLKADALLLLTDVDAVYQGFGTDSAKALTTITPEEALALDLPDGSMGPKVRAAARFAVQGGFCGIGRLQDALHLLGGMAGTRIAPAQGKWA